VKRKKEASELIRRARETKNDDELKLAALMKVEADREIAQDGTFMTIETSMTTNDPPVLMFSQGLPEWMMYQDTALSLAKSCLGEDVHLVETARSVPGAPIMFTFSDSAGKQIYVNPVSRKVFAERKQTSNQSQTAQSRPDNGRAGRVRAQWNVFLTDGIDINQFSVAGLTDLSKPK
jgi:hypothetical protein